MRTRLNALLPTFLIAIMLGSVALPQLSNVPDEPQQLDDVSGLFEASGRSSSTILAAGSGQANEDGEHIAALPNGGWVVGVSEWTNSTRATAPTRSYQPHHTIQQDSVSFISPRWMIKVRGLDSSALITAQAVVVFQL